MSRETFINGFRKVAEQHGVDADVLADFYVSNAMPKTAEALEKKAFNLVGILRGLGTVGRATGKALGTSGRATRALVPVGERGLVPPGGRGLVSAGRGFGSKGGALVPIGERSLGPAWRGVGRTAEPAFVDAESRWVDPSWRDKLRSVLKGVDKQTRHDLAILGGGMGIGGGAVGLSNMHSNKIHDDELKQMLAQIKQLQEENSRLSKPWYERLFGGQ